MTDIAIRVENLSKLYYVGKAQRRNDTLRNAITDASRRWNGRACERDNVGTFERLDVPTVISAAVMVGSNSRAETRKLPATTA